MSDDHGPTDRNSFRYGVSCGLGAAAVLAERAGRKDLADKIRGYEVKTTNITFGAEKSPVLREMTYADLGIPAPGEMKASDLGLDDEGRIKP